MVRARDLAILELGLRHCRLEVHVPQRRGFDLIRQSALQRGAETRPARRAAARADRGVRHRPVDREAQISPQVLERLLVFGRQPVAELDEVGPGDRNRVLARFLRRAERRIVRQRRIAPDAVVVLHAALGWQPVVIPPHRIEDRLAAHPLKTRDDIGVRVREDMAHVERSADGGRRRVDGKDLSAPAPALEAIDALFFPAGHPLGFEAFQGWFLREAQARGIQSRQGGRRTGHQGIVLQIGELVGSGEVTGVGGLGDDRRSHAAQGHEDARARNASCASWLRG